MRKPTKVLLQVQPFAATSRARSFIESVVCLSPVTGRDLALLFFFSWLATLLPLTPHPGPTLWVWGAVSGVLLVATAALLFHLNQRRSVVWSLLGCVALISIGGLFDFLRLSPVYLMSQCSTSTDADFFTKILRHIEFHFQLFPITTVAMLLWICLGFSGFAEISAAKMGVWKDVLRCVRRHILPRLGYCLLMLVCMGVAMSGFESLGVTLQRGLSADGLVSAMLCGMALYHLVLNLHLHFSRTRTIPHLKDDRNYGTENR